MICGRSMVRSSQSAHRQKRNTFRFVTRGFMPSINVMAVCDAKMRFTNLVAKWHGSVYDSAIFNGSALQIHMKKKQQQGWLLGERGTPYTATFTTPLNPDKVSSAVEENCQRSRTRKRNMTKRSFGNDSVLPNNVTACDTIVLRQWYWITCVSLTIPSFQMGLMLWSLMAVMTGPCLDLHNTVN